MHTLLIFIAHYKSSTICTLSFKLLTAVFSILVTSRQANFFNLLNTVELDQEIEKIYIYLVVSFRFSFIWLHSYLFVVSAKIVTWYAVFVFVALVCAYYFGFRRANLRSSENWDEFAKRYENLSHIIAGVRSPERPVVPNITALSTTEVRITWCRVNSNKVEIDHYELFIDSELEYSGIDVMYVAKRLKPWSWYEVKLRACGFSPGSCSPFSRPALVKTLRDSKCCTTILITTSGTACYSYSFALSQNFYSTTVWQAKRVHIYLFTVL